MSVNQPTSQSQEKFSWSVQHAQATGDTTIEVAKPTRAFLITDVRYVNPTGLAVDATNFFTLQVLIQAAVAAEWSTETTVGEGALVAATWVDLTDGTTALRRGDAGDEVSILLDEDGTATLPPGAFYIEGIFL
jgi:hypothetical protein